MSGRAAHGDSLAGDGGHFLHQCRDGFDIITLDTEAAFRLVECMLPDPDGLFRVATIFKPGSRTHGGRLLLDGISCFLKRYNDRGIWYRFRHAFGASRAVRTWRIAWAMLEAGIPVPEPLACLEERRGRLLFRSYVLMRFATGCERLRDLWGNLAVPDREALLAHLAGIFAHMHRAGALHGDLKWDNVLVAPDDLSRVCLVDLDGSRFTARIDRRRAEKDLQRFLRDLEIYGDTGMTEKFAADWRQKMLAR